MKKLIFIAIGSFLIAACNNAELNQAKHENDSLKALLGQRDTSVNYYISAFNDVERNLDSVTAQQMVIASDANKTDGEMKQDQKERITAEIATINNLMDENKKKIADLNRKLKGSNKKNADLVKAIADLNSRLTQKETELTALNEKLTTLSSQITQLETNVGVLTADNAAKDQVIEEKTTALHTAYYLAGTSKELQDAKVIDKKGGLLGIGKTAQLSSTIDKSKFTRIDYTQVSTIPVNGSDIKIITSHPADSYTLQKDEKKKGLTKNIIISDADKFWGNSKYLVVMKD